MLPFPSFLKSGDEILKCGVENSFNGVPWLGQFSSVNETASFEEVENVSSGVISSCTLQEFQQFESFFSKFMNVAREFFLAPERHRFGLVSERSMLSSLGLEDSSSWLAVLHVAGCPTCSRILKEEDDLKDILQMDSSVVTEVILISLLFYLLLILVLYEVSLCHVIFCQKLCVAKTVSDL